MAQRVTKPIADGISRKDCRGALRQPASSQMFGAGGPKFLQTQKEDAADLGSA